MEVLAEIRQRYSCRAYQDRPVEQEKLDRVLEAARLAPSARNMQEFVGQAPVVIVACAEQAEYRMRCGQLAHPIDVAIALEHMALQAVREGLATCWVGSFFPEQVRNVLGIPEHISLVELLPLGYPADKPKPKSRVAMEKIACYDRWSL